ncbi:unnamed protein product [Brassica oleracea var. botrytis]
MVSQRFLSSNIKTTEDDFNEKKQTPKLKQYVKSPTHLNLTHLSTMATKIA